MSDIPLVRRAIAGAALAHNVIPTEENNPLVVQPQENQWTPAALERAGSTLKALNRMAKRPPVHILFEDISYTVHSHIGKIEFSVSYLDPFLSSSWPCRLRLSNKIAIITLRYKTFLIALSICSCATFFINTPLFLTRIL